MSFGGKYVLFHLFRSINACIIDKTILEALCGKLNIYKTYVSLLSASLFFLFFQYSTLLRNWVGQAPVSRGFLYCKSTALRTSLSCVPFCV